jgi:O-antigen ligase
LVTPSTFFPYIFGKAIIFQIIVEICLIFWVVWIVIDRQERLFSGRWMSSQGSSLSGNMPHPSRLSSDTNIAPKIKDQKQDNILFYLKAKSFLNYAVIGFFIVLLLTTLTSLDQLRSFWSTQERMTGFFNLIHFGMFYLVLITVFQKKDFIWLLRLSLAITIIISIIAITQNWKTRLYGPLGNPGFLALYMLFHIFLGLYLLFLKNKNQLINWLWKGFYFTSVVINIFVLYFTKTRGAYLGLSIGLLIFVTINCKGIIRYYKAWSIWKRWAAPGFLVLFLGFSFFVMLNQKENFTRLSRERVISWGVSFNAFKERPFLGWGHENFILAFSRHYDPEYADYSLEWFDKAHNVFFEYLVTTGMFGLVAYLALFVFASARSPKFIMPLLTAYFVTNLFWFDTTISLMFFFLTLAMANKDIFNFDFKRPGV